MKYKVVANGAIMGVGMTALRALNMVCNILRGFDIDDGIKVEIFHLSKKNGEPCWKLENSFALKGGN